MNTTATFPGFETLVKPFKFAASPYEYKVTALRECPTPYAMQHCETPDKTADYWRMHIATRPHFNPDCECLAMLILNTRRRVKGHQLVSIGTMDTILVHPREVFRLAIITAASALIVMHNHPSGETGIEMRLPGAVRATGVGTQFQGGTDCGRIGQTRCNSRG
jgi:hypothetical protein